MRIDDYPAQEPFTAIGGTYHEEVLRRGAGLAAIERAYGPDPYQRIAIVPAEAPNGLVLVALHGGGWTNGYKEWMLFMAPAFAPFGVTFVSVGYRLAPGTIFPDGYHNVLDGLALVHACVADWGGDPARIFLTGHSAGGHLAALAAVRDDWQTSRGLPATVVRGALPISGTYQFGPDSGLSVRPRFLGPPEAAQEAAASPLNFLRAGLPPFFIATGDADFAHLRRQALHFADGLRRFGNGPTEMVLPQCDHLGASYASAAPMGAWATTARAFMQRHA